MVARCSLRLTVLQAFNGAWHVSWAIGALGWGCETLWDSETWSASPQQLRHLSDVESSMPYIVQQLLGNARVCNVDKSSGLPIR